MSIILMIAAAETSLALSVIGDLGLPMGLA